MFVELLLLLVALGVFQYWKFHSKSNYWTEHGVIQASDNAFPLGNNTLMCAKSLLGFVNLTNVGQKQYDAFKGEKYFGTYGMGVPPPPILVIRDLDLASGILVRDFDHFVDRMLGGFDLGMGTSETDRMWNKTLLSLKGDEWREVRATFSPIFTSSKMKMMVPFIYKIGELLNRDIGLAAEESRKIDLKELLGKFSMETIASCAFGVDTKSFSTFESPFVKNANKIFNAGLLDGLRKFAYCLPGSRQLIELFKIPITMPGPSRFFMKSISKTIRHRIDSSYCRHDLVDLMIEAMTKKSNNDKRGKNELDEFVVVANALLILVTGYYTTALTMSKCLWLLARYPEIQDRLQAEIDEAFESYSGGDDQLDYLTVENLKYLDMVINETMRLHTPVGLLSRVCTKEYAMPGTGLKIPVGSEIHILPASIHMDEQHYPDPTSFDPERFCKEARATRHPMAFMPFGQGPRACMGSRFALLEAKIAMVTVLRKYRMKTCPETPKVVRQTTGSLTNNSAEPLWVIAEERILV
jgi:cytochrome P450 family 6